MSSLDGDVVLLLPIGGSLPRMRGGGGRDRIVVFAPSNRCTVCTYTERYYSCPPPFLHTTYLLLCVRMLCQREKKEQISSSFLGHYMSLPHKLLKGTMKVCAFSRGKGGEYALLRYAANPFFTATFKQTSSLSSC